MDIELLETLLRILPGMEVTCEEGDIKVLSRAFEIECKIKVPGGMWRCNLKEKAKKKK